jgi:hypothetical protein
MRHFTDEMYEQLAQVVADEIRTKSYFNGHIGYEINDLSGRLTLTAMIYWDRGKDGAGMEVAELKEIVPAWWALDSFGENNDRVLTDFSWDKFKNHLYSAI